VRIRPVLVLSCFVKIGFPTALQPKLSLVLLFLRFLSYNETHGKTPLDE
jgi:hypothetical protein